MDKSMIRNKDIADKSILNKIGRWIGLMVPCFIIVLGCIFDYIYYIQTDDYEMNYISMGGISGEPNEHIIFIKSILGCVLKNLYNIYNHINWFGVTYLFLILMCVYILLFTLKKYIEFHWALLISIMVEMVVLCWLTFTVIAYLCTVTAGVKWIESTSIEEGHMKNDILNGFLVVFLFVSGYVLRENALISGVILLIPFLIFFIKNIRKKMSIIVVLLSLVCIVCVAGFEKKTYESDLWQNYKEYNALRAAMVDYPINDYDEHKKEYDELELSRNDYECLTNWIFADKEVYSAKTLEKILDNIKIERKYELNIFKVGIKMLRTKEFWFFVLFSILIIYLSKQQRRYQFVESLFTIGLVGILFVINRALIRVYVPIYLTGILCMLYIYCKYCYKETALGKKRWLLILLLFVTLVPTMLYLSMAYNNGKVKEERKLKYAQEREYIHNHQDKFFVVERMYNLMQYQPVLKINERAPFINVMDVGHWQIYNDVYYKQAEIYKFEKTDRLLMNIVENDNFLYLHDANESDLFLQRIKRYLEEHGDESVNMKKVYEFKDTEDVLYHMSTNKN